VREVGLLRRLWFAPGKLLDAPLAQFSHLAQVACDSVAFAARQASGDGVDVGDHRGQQLGEHADCLWRCVLRITLPPDVAAAGGGHRVGADATQL
jgi:hypothetical protein